MGISHYELLGIGLEATPEEIERAYRSASKLFHPDADGPAANSALFREATMARDTLIDPSKRRLYDEGLERTADTGVRTQTSDHPSSTPPPAGNGGTRTGPPTSNHRTRRSYSLLWTAGAAYLVSRWVIQLGYQAHISLATYCGHQLMASSGFLLVAFFFISKDRLKRLLSWISSLLSRPLARRFRESSKH